MSTHTDRVVSLIRKNKENKMSTPQQRYDAVFTRPVEEERKLRESHSALLAAAKIALPGLRHLAQETKFAGVAADAQMAANTLESAIKNCEEA